jgi:hypothetical protein
MFTGVNDTADKFFHWRWTVLMTEDCSFCKTISSCRYCHWKRRKGTSHTLIRGPWGRQNYFKPISGHRSRPRPPILSLEGPRGHQNYFKPKRHYLVLAASGASDQDVWGVFGCNFSWQFQWHHRHVRRRWPEINMSKSEKSAYTCIQHVLANNFFLQISLKFCVFWNPYWIFE